MRIGDHFRFGLLLSAVLLVADRLSKYWVLNGLNLADVGTIPLLPFLNFTMVLNEGISMSLPVGDWLGRWGLIILTGCISLWLLNWLRTSEKRFEATALAMIIGGAVGNIIDRFIYGAVVDFIHLHAWGYSFYVFNVADSAITVGAVLLLFDGLRDGRKGPKNASKTHEVDAPERPDPSGSTLKE